ncbi:transposase, partial [Thalassotalea sp. G20_0]
IKNKKRIIVTTPLDSEQYPRSEIVSLYLARWHVELDLRAIKSLMKVGVLRCKTPEMVTTSIESSATKFSLFNEWLSLVIIWISISVLLL